MINKLVIISKEYPTDTDPIYSFVDQLARGIADRGVQLCVIAPLSVTRALMHRKTMPPRRTVVRTDSGNEFTVLRPRTISASDGVRLGIDCAMLTYRLFKRSVRRALRGIGWTPIALYGHFISLSGMCASELGREMGIPSFLGYGESSPALYAQYSRAALRTALQHLSGAVAVSSENARELMAVGVVAPDLPVEVLPNAVNTARFHPMDRADARAQLGFDQGAFIVAFVGAFIERKGITVLSDALSQLGDVQSVFIGKGGLMPTCSGALHVGPLPNEDVPMMLAAADAFVLPTRAEGCCNAIVEALSMGLPVISSALPFNDDILSDDNSLRIDPNSVDDVAKAIAALRDDPALRARLAQGALVKGRELEMPRRVQGILAFMERCRQ